MGMQKTWNTPVKPWSQQVRRKAIVTGFIAMFVINFILTTTVAILFRAQDVINHDYSAFSRKFYRDLSKSPEFLTTLFVAEVISYMLAVLIAARFSRGYYMANAMLLAAMFAGVDIILMFTSTTPVDWSAYADLLTVFPLCYAGAKLAERRARS